ncbi:hypothetical protein HYX16_01435 [Candidatus Woesearchaeota archaeon]|nr:hypothetical protein [Candidatus Woesearchaeota archaeon]
MYVKLKTGKQKILLTKAIKFAGSQRKLAKITRISKGSICDYVRGSFMTEKRFNKIADFLNIKDKERLIEEKKPDNWRQILGGKKCVISKKNKGTFLRDMKHINKLGAKTLKKWHQDMKATYPEEYYNIQYSRFKKMYGYKHTTMNGEKVRNIWEKQIADILSSLRINYEYEPLVRANKKYFFPDFVINKKIILEVTRWKGIENAFKLKSKIKALKDNYQIFVVIPKNLKSYYSLIGDNLIIGLEEFARIAQTFPKK